MMEKMMRLFIVNLVVAGLLFFGAASASAISLSVSALTPTTINVGETVTIEMRMDTEAETQITSVFTSMSNSNPGALEYTSGTSPNAILLNFSTYANLGKVGEPQDGVSGDAPGRVRVASYATSNPDGSGRASANQLLGTIIYTATSAGTIDISALLELGVNPDEITVSQVSVTGSVSIGPAVTITVVPEPGTAILMGLGLAGLAGAGRRRTA
jgi:hypothetical protein